MVAPRIGFSTMVGSNEMTALPGQLDLIQSIGASVAELSALHDDLIMRHRLIPGRMALLKSILADRPMDYSVHAAIGLNFMLPPAHKQLHLDVAKAYVELAAEIGAEHVVIHSGQYPGRLTQAELAHRYDQQRECLKHLGDFAAQHGCLICVENVFYWNQEHSATPSELAAELKAVDHSHVCATFDFAHAALNLEDVGEVFLAEAATLTPYSKHLHLHDNFGVPNRTQTYTFNEELAFGEGDLHLPLYWGSLPWDLLAEMKYPEDPLFMIELNPQFWREAQEMVNATRCWAEKVVG